MTEKVYFIKNVPTNVPVKHTIKLMQKQYSLPKIYIRRDANKTPIVGPGNNWYVYYYYRDPDSNKMKKFIYKYGLNRFKTISERKHYAKQIVEALTELLESGYNPFLKEGLPTNTFESNKTYTLTEAVNYVLEQKSKRLKTASIKDYNFRLGHFLDWCKKVGVHNNDVTSITKKHVIAFLNTLELSNTSVNNYKRALSAIFGYLSKEGIINANIAKELPTLKSKPKKNTPFTPKQIQTITKHLKQTDPYMVDFIKFVFYGFLRITEIIRLKPKNIDLENNVYRVETKSDVFKTKVLVPQLKDVVLKYMQQGKIYEDEYLFTNENKIKKWQATEKTKTDHFRKRFKKAKKHLGFNEHYGLYSFRHSAAIDNYNHYKKQGLNDYEIINKLVIIIGHSGPEVTRKYLRDVQANLPKEYGSNFSVKF